MLPTRTGCTVHGTWITIVSVTHDNLIRVYLLPVKYSLSSYCSWYSLSSSVLRRKTRKKDFHGISLNKIIFSIIPYVENAVAILCYLPRTLCCVRMYTNVKHPSRIADAREVLLKLIQAVPVANFYIRINLFYACYNRASSDVNIY